VLLHGRSEGWDTLRWVIIDFVDFVVHVFHEEARLFYNLERIWADAPTEEIKDEPKPAPKKRASAKKSQQNQSPVISSYSPLELSFGINFVPLNFGSQASSSRHIFTTWSSI